MTDGPSPRELQVGGAVPLDTGVYIVRRTDAELLEALRQGEYCNLLCPRQMGKTSSIMRIRAELRSSGFRTALIDIAGRLGTPANADAWYVGLLSHLSSQFNLGCNVKAWWTASVEPTANQKLLAFFRDEILARNPGDRFVVFLDEIDHTLNLPYTDDFFLAIRSLYNDRAGEPDLRRLTFCLVGVFTPNELVKRQRTTTYNVGRTFELQDFDSGRDDLTPLSRTLSPDPARGEALLGAVLRWTGGQPYLTASVCKKVGAAGVGSGEAVDRLIEESFLAHERALEQSDDIHFESVVRFLGERVRARLATVNLYRRLLRGGEERDRPTPPVLALKLSGLVKTGRDARLTIRNEIYRRRFDAKWATTVVPLTDRWGRPAAVALAALIFVIVGVNHLWVRPKGMLRDIANTDDYRLAEGKWQKLRKTLFWSERADEAWADFSRRRAQRAESAGDRDASLLWRLSAVGKSDREFDRRAAGSLVLDDYPALTNTIRLASGVTAVAFSPNGETVVTVSGDDTARLWNAHTGAPIGQPLQLQSVVSAVALSPNGKTVVTGFEDGTARLWDASTGEQAVPSLKNERPVYSVTFSPNGKTVVTGSADGTVRLWSASTGAPIGQPLTNQSSVTALAFSPDGETVVSGSSHGTVRLWNARTGAPIGQPLQHQGFVFAVAFRPSGETFVTVSRDGIERLWNVRSGEPIGQPLQHQGSVYAVAFSTNGETVVTDSANGPARLWNARTGEPIGPPLQHQGNVTAVAFSPDGETVVTGSADGTVRLWSASTGAPTGQPLQHHGSVYAVAFSPDGETLVTGSWDKTARLWNARTGAPIAQPLKHLGIVAAVAFSPHGETVVTGSWDGTARLWNARTGEPIGPPLKPQGNVRAVAFSPNGETVVTGSDNTVRLWNARTGAPIGQPLDHQNIVTAVAFSADGSRLLCNTHAWIHEYQASREGFRPLCSRYLGSMPVGGIQPTDQHGDWVRVLTTAGEARLRTIAVDFSDAIPLVGDPAELLKSWQTRLGLRIDADGRLMTPAGEEWIAGEGIHRALPKGDNRGLFQNSATNRPRSDLKK